MKKAGIQSVEEAERFINLMDGGKVLIAVVIGLVLHFVTELPNSGLLKRLREEREHPSTEPRAPRQGILARFRPPARAPAAPSTALALPGAAA